MADTGISVDDLKTELAKVRTAISDILTAGQSYNRQGLSLQMATLDALQNREKYLVRSINRAGDGVVAALEVTPTTYPSDQTDDFEEA